MSASYVVGDSCKTGTFTAGSAPCKATVTLTTGNTLGYVGVPVTLYNAAFSDAFSSITPASGVTGSAGTIAATFTPSNLVAHTPSFFIGYLGNSQAYSTLSSVTIAPSSPSAVGIASIAADTASNGLSYTTTAQTAISVATPGAVFPYTTIQFALEDAFGNSVPLNTLTSWTITLTANAGGAFDAKTATGTSLVTTINCAYPTGGPEQVDWETGSTAITGSEAHGAGAAVACPSLTQTTPFNLPFDYYNGPAYGNTTGITLTISGTVGAGSFPSKSTVSNRLVTSTFEATQGAPTISTATPAAGKTVKVTVTLGTVQKNVPVTIQLDTATSFETSSGAKDYGAASVLKVGFTNNALSITNTTTSAGVTTATFTVDTVAGATAYFNATVAAPTNALGVSNTLANSGDSAAAVTQAGSLASIILKTYFTTPPAEPTTKATNGTSVYLDAIYSDKYGNAEAVCTQANQVSINLAVSGVGGGGLISANPVYVKNGICDTQASFGSILWTMPNAFGAVTVTATAVVSGVKVTGTASVTVISPVPTMAVSFPAPLNNVIYSNSGFTTFNGWAAVSLGFPQSVSSCTTPNDCISSIDYTATSGSTTTSGSTFFTAANNATWSVTLSLPSGLSSVTFNATDANGFTVATAKYTVLVDSTAPDVNFVTAANANISSPATVTANIVDPMGDLGNASGAATPQSGVTAVATNLDTSATKSLSVSVTGSNNPGHSVTYGVTLSGLTTGNWSIALNAMDLAGNVNNTQTLTVHVTVPFAQSFVVSGTPTTTTLGLYSGISATYTNLNPTSQSVVIFAVFKNGAGQTVGIGTGSATFGAGATQSVFIADPIGLASGTYSVSIFVYTSSNLPVSVSTSISVTA